MASPPLLNIAELTASLQGENPAGVPTPYTLKQELQEARKEFDLTPEGPVPRKQEWDKIIKASVENLRTKSKDLDLATRLTEALMKKNGFAGLRDGLSLIRQMVVECWERMYPNPDEEINETMAVRAEFLENALSDPTAGTMFPNSVRSLPVLQIGEHVYSLMDRQFAAEGRKTEVGVEDFNRAQLVHPQVLEDLEQANQEFQQLNKALAEKLGPDAPNLEQLEKAIGEYLALLKHIRGLNPETSGEEQPQEDVSENGTAKQAAAPGVSKLPMTRDDAYRQINQIANILEKLEPHSPIPDLLRRAVELGKMPFRQLIRELVRDEAKLKDLRREFGIPSE